MPRQARHVFPNVTLHVRQRGHNRQPCFSEETDYLVYLSSLAELAAKTACALHAYCLMTNHVHLLLTPAGEDSCARLLRGLGQRYVQYFNRRHGRTGTLWEGRPRSCLVESSEYVLACYRYIELNPVRAGMVASPAEYRWSSYHGNAGRISNKALTPHVEYLALSEDDAMRHRSYVQMLDSEEDGDFLKAVREATDGGLALLSDQAKAKLELLGGRKLEHKRPGPISTKAGGDPFSGSFDF